MRVNGCEFYSNRVVTPDVLIDRFLEILSLDMIPFYKYLPVLQRHLIAVSFQKLFWRYRYIDKYEYADQCNQLYLIINPIKEDYSESYYQRPYKILKQLLRIMIYHPTEWREEYESVFKSVPRPRDFDAKKKRDLKKSLKNASNSDPKFSEPNKSDEFIQIQILLKVMSRSREKIQFNQKWKRVLLMKQIIDFPQKKIKM